MEADVPLASNRMYAALPCTSAQSVQPMTRASRATQFALLAVNAATTA